MFLCVSAPHPPAVDDEDVAVDVFARARAKKDRGPAEIRGTAEWQVCNVGMCSYAKDVPLSAKTEVVAGHVEMLSGRRKKDYAAESAAEALAAQAEAMGYQPQDASAEGESDADDGAASTPFDAAEEELASAVA